MLRDGFERQGRDELGSRRGHGNAYLGPFLLKEAAEEHGLIGGNAPRDSHENATSGQKAHTVIIMIWRFERALFKRW
jgi:hypothetical protein